MVRPPPRAARGCSSRGKGRRRQPHGAGWAAGRARRRRAMGRWTRSRHRGDGRRGWAMGAAIARVRLLDGTKPSIDRAPAWAGSAAARVRWRTPRRRGWGAWPGVAVGICARPRMHGQCKGALPEFADGTGASAQPERAGGPSRAVAGRGAHADVRAGPCCTRPDVLIQGVDVVGRKHQRNTNRKAPKSKNVYLQLLVKVRAGAAPRARAGARRRRRG